MLYGDKREMYRTTFFEVWRKHKENKPLEPMEKRILGILLQHKEYIPVFENLEKNIDKNYFSELGETNPFLHISLHLTILDQIAIDQPRGIRGLYKKCVECFEDIHEGEHCIMNSLAIGIQELNTQPEPFDNKKYLKRIKKSIRDGYW